MCVCVRACVRACVCVCVHACEHSCVCMCMHTSDHIIHEQIMYVCLCACTLLCLQNISLD